MWARKISSGQMVEKYLCQNQSVGLMVCYVLLLHLLHLTQRKKIAKMKEKLVSFALKVESILFL